MNVKTNFSTITKGLGFKILMLYFLASLLWLTFMVLTSAFFTIRVDEMSLASDYKHEQENFSTILEIETKMLSTNLTSLGTIETLKDKFITRDRESLYNESIVYFEKLKQDAGITHLYFTTKEGEIFLRVHDKNNFGDKISRLTFAESSRTQSRVTGIELGKTGFALRTVMPYYKNGEIIGYIEMGEEINHFISILERSSGSQYQVIGNKKYLNQKDWNNLAEKLEIDNGWDDYVDHAVVAESANNENVGRCLIGSNTINLDKGNFLQFINNGRNYSCGSIPITTVGGMQIGSIIISDDYTDSHSIYYRAEFWILFSCVTVFSILFIAVYFSLKSYFIKPLRDTKEIIDRIIDTGDLSLRVPETSEDEIGALAKSFNILRLKLLNLQQNLESKVAKRTADLERINQAMVGREIKMIELKQKLAQRKGHSSEDKK